MNDSIQIAEWVAAPCLVVTGVSHWVWPKAWCALFRRWVDQGPAGARKNGLLHAVVGATFLLAHPVFIGWCSIPTYWACAVLVKGLVVLARPGLGLASMRLATTNRAERLRWAGVPMVALGVYCAACASL